MGNFRQDLDDALSICSGIIRAKEEFYKIYSFTTESISEYMKYFDFKDKSLLTVGSSGDQVLNAFYNGARDITLFDINKFAKYYVYLKIAAINSLDYEEFLMFFFKRDLENHYSNKNMFSKDLFNKIKPSLEMYDFESFLFFDGIFSLYNSVTIRDYLFDDDECRNPVIKKFNIYLENEELYNKLKSIINEISFKYICGNIFKDDIPCKYDNIILSNLCTTTSLKNLKKLLTKLDLNNLNEDGSILFGYLWDIEYFRDDYSSLWKEVYRMPITKEILGDYITEHHQIKGARDFLFNKNEKSDLVLIYRKK